MINNETLILTRDIILIDTCSLMSSEFVTFMEQTRSLLLENNKYITIGSCVISELNKLSLRDDTKGELARKTLENIKYYEYEGLLIIEHDENQNIRPDDYFLGYCATNRCEKNILIITQDYMLCRAIISLNNNGISRSAKRIFVKRIATLYGTLSNFDITAVPNQFTKRSMKTNASEIINKLKQNS